MIHALSDWGIGKSDERLNRKYQRTAQLMKTAGKQ
jgi:hypothetical protein